MAEVVMQPLGITWQNNLLTGLSMVTQTNNLFTLVAGSRRGYKPAPDIIPGEIWIKDYTGMSDLDEGIPENRRDVMIHMQNVIVDGMSYPESDMCLFTYYEGKGTSDILKLENVGVANGVCPLGSDKLVPAKYIPKDLSYVPTQPGKTPIFGDAEGKLEKNVIKEQLIDTSQANKAGGYAKVENTGKISSSLLPDDSYILASTKGGNNGVCPLDSSGKIPDSVFNITSLKKLLGLK